VNGTSFLGDDGRGGSVLFTSARPRGANDSVIDSNRFGTSPVAAISAAALGSFVRAGEVKPPSPVERTLLRTLVSRFWKNQVVASAFASVSSWLAG
jgi:hypothetical protein